MCVSLAHCSNSFSALTRIIETIQSEEYTFRPKLKIDENLLAKRVGGLARLATPSARYTEPYCPPEEERSMPSKRRRGRRKKPIESLWATNDGLRKSFNNPR